jgi:hypothetical protein
MSGRRPKRSDSAPMTSCPAAGPTMNVVNVNWIADAGVWDCATMAGSAGSYLSRKNGPPRSAGQARRANPVATALAVGALDAHSAQEYPENSGAVCGTPPSGRTPRFSADDSDIPGKFPG